MSCPSCGALAPEGARFCPECGQRLVVAPEERRLVTVLMADLVGFTALSESNDPEQVKRVVDDCFARLVSDVTAFGGRLDKIVGDQIVALFGTPVAHEDDAERAVRAALRMQETLARLTVDVTTPLQIRIGVNTGEVLVGAMRAGGDETVMGDVVNTAQRLQTLAEPGHVVVGAPTHAATRGAIRYEPLGSLPVKGRDEPVEAYRALEALTPPGRRRERGRTPLVGRDAEMAALRHMLQVSAVRRRAQLVVLYGDAGVGKSRLADELAELARTELGARVLAGQSVPYGDANVFGPVAEALRHACGIEGLAAASDARRRVAETVSALLGLGTDTAETERLVEGLVFVMEGVTRPGVDPGRARDEGIRAVVAFVEALASRAPLVITLSDLHWAHDAVLELTDRLLVRLAGLPLVVVGTARPGTERLVREPGRYSTLALHLDPLDAEATAQLVQALFEGCADDDLVAMLRDRSGGNPFFVEELAAFVREAAHERHVDARSIGVHDLPATLHGLVAARLDVLDREERSLLQDCAVVGASGPVSAVEVVGGSDARRLLESLEERDLLVLDGDDFHFKSELIREVAYGTLTKAERARRHAEIARVLSPRGEVVLDQVAHHLATAAELVDEIGPAFGVPPDVHARAVAALLASARRAEEVETWILSGRFHDRALGLIHGDDDAARWTALLGRARSRIAQRALHEGAEDALLVLEEAREADDVRTEAAALNLLGEAHVASGDYESAESVLGQAVQKWREVGEVSGVANALRGLGIAHLFRGETPEAQHLISDALASYRSVGDRRGEAWALQNLAWISFTRGETRDAEQRLQQSAELFGELGDWGGLGWAFGLLAFVRYNQGKLEEAAELAEQILDEAHETGNRWAVGMMRVLLSNVALWKGRGEDAVRHGREALSLFREIGDAWGEVQASAPVVRALGELGRLAEFREARDRLADVAGSLPDAGMRRVPALVEACVVLQLGDAESAQAVLDTVEVPSEERVGWDDLAGAYGLAALQRGAADEAVELLEKSYAGAEHDGAVLALGSRLALAYTAAHRPHDALRVVAEIERRSGGTYSDRMFALWAEAFARAQTHDGDARAAVDAAHAIATATDSPVEQAIAALARAKLLEAVGAHDAAEVRADAERQLGALGIRAEGWSRLFSAALAPAAA